MKQQIEDIFKKSFERGMIHNDFNPFKRHYRKLYECVLKAMDEYAKIKMIEENKSLLEMAKLHMDSRAILVISERISELEK